MDIKEIRSITNSDNEEFVENLDEAIKRMQENKLTVEVQYKVNTSYAQIIYSALLIGRVKKSS